MDNIKVHSRNQAVKATRQVHELEMLYKISRILSGGTTRKKALADVLNSLENELGLNRGTITLLSPDGNEIRIEVARELLQLFRLVTFRVDGDKDVVDLVRRHLARHQAHQVQRRRTDVRTLGIAEEYHRPLAAEGLAVERLAIALRQRELRQRFRGIEDRRRFHLRPGIGLVHRHREVDARHQSGYDQSQHGQELETPGLVSSVTHVHILYLARSVTVVVCLALVRQVQGQPDEGDAAGEIQHVQCRIEMH